VEVNLYKLKPGKLCFIRVTEREALQLIQSLTNQLLTKNPNTGRLESHCTGDVTEMTIAIQEMVSNGSRTS
jgi:hypothetical protein